MAKRWQLALKDKFRAIKRGKWLFVAFLFFQEFSLVEKYFFSSPPAKLNFTDCFGHDLCKKLYLPHLTDDNLLIKATEFTWKLVAGKSNASGKSGRVVYGNNHKIQLRRP